MLYPVLCDSKGCIKHSRCILSILQFYNKTCDDTPVAPPKDIDFSLGRCYDDDKPAWVQQVAMGCDTN